MRSGGEVFGALSSAPASFAADHEREHGLRDDCPAQRGPGDGVRDLPHLPEGIARDSGPLETFAADSDPVVQALQPTARELAPTLTSLARLSDQLDPFFVGLRGTIDAAPKGSAALRRLLDVDLPPLLDRFDPFLAELNPILEVVRIYRMR